MSQTVVSLRGLPSSPGRAGWRAIAARLWAPLAGAWEEARTRRMLAGLDARDLRDIGLSRAQAQFLAERPVWELVPFLHR